MEVSTHDGSSSTNVKDSSSRAVEVPWWTCPTGTFSFRTSCKFLFTCPWTSTNELSEYNSVRVFHILINYYEFTCCIENSVYPDQLASELKPADLNLHCLQDS